jgi:hypothetical protein
MQFLLFLGPLLALLGLMGSKNEDDEPEVETREPIPPFEPEEDDNPDEDENPDEEENVGDESAIDIRIFADADIPQEAIDAAAAAEALLEDFLLTVDEFGSQRDLNITLEQGEIDGEGGTGALTYIEGFRVGEPVGTARIVLDSDDLADMIANGNFDEVMEHEIIHAMGLGVKWRQEDFIEQDENGTNIFIGERATEQFEILTGNEDLPGVPVAEGFGHWLQDAIPGDIMNPTVYDGSVITNVTLGSLEDIGIPIDPSIFDEDPDAVSEDDIMMV